MRAFILTFNFLILTFKLTLIYIFLLYTFSNPPTPRFRIFQERFTFRYEEIF